MLFKYQYNYHARTCLKVRTCNYRRSELKSFPCVYYTGGGYRRWVTPFKFELLVSNFVHILLSCYSILVYSYIIHMKWLILALTVRRTTSEILNHLLHKNRFFHIFFKPLITSVRINLHLKTFNPPNVNINLWSSLVFRKFIPIYINKK